MLNHMHHPFLAGMERRLSLRLLAYWEKLRAGDPIPEESLFNQYDIADMWGSCFLLHTDRFNEPGYHYTHMGDDIMKVWCGEANKDTGEALISPKISHLSEIYAQIIRDQKPFIDEGEFINLDNQPVRFRRCFLPLGKNGKVTAILGGMHFKVF